MAKTKVSEWSPTPDSNSDVGGINIAEGMAPSGINNAIREMMSQVKEWQSGESGDPSALSQGTEVDLASAATTDIGVQSTNFIRVTGTTTITSFGTNYNGPKFMRFAGAVTLTNSSTLILPGGANFTTSVGDVLIACPKATSGVNDGWYVVQLPTSLAGYVTATGVATLTNKTITFADNTLTGVASTSTSQTLTNKTLTSPTLTGTVLNDGYTEEVYELTGTAIDAANGSIQYKTLSANTTFTESLADGQSVVLMLNPSTYTTTWPGGIAWIGNVASTAPTLIASVYNCITLFQINGTVYGKYEGRV
jgi:hypothetical protein